MRNRKPTPDIPHELDARLANWGAYYRDRRQVGISITGLICERLARSKGQIEAAREPAPEIDAADAQHVNRAWQSPMMPARPKALLSAHYAHRVDWRDTCRMLGIWRGNYARELWQAAHTINNILRVLDMRTQAVAQSSANQEFGCEHGGRMREQASAPLKRAANNNQARCAA